MQLLDINLITPDEDQPRKTFYNESLEELAQSIRERGVLQPIVVRPMPDGRYQIVMGERRYRASCIAGLTHMPAIVRELSDEETKADALLENFQREDLNPIERGRAIQGLLEIMSMEQTCKTLGVAESTIRRYLELLDLPVAVQNELISADEKPGEGAFTEGHARLMRQFNGDVKTQMRLVQKIKSEKLSIDDTSKLIQAVNDVPDKAEAFMRVPLNVTEEILRHTGKAKEKRRPFKAQTAENHLKSMIRTSSTIIDMLDERIAEYLSGTQVNQLLSTTADLTERLEKFSQQIRMFLQRNDGGFKEVYVHCPLCGRLELIGSMRCGVCWSVLRRCIDCGYYDQLYNRCSQSGEYVYLSDAEDPDDQSKSYKCENYKPKFETKRVA
jgi:ParB family chromosome partitioning protein